MLEKINKEDLAINHFFKSTKEFKIKMLRLYKNLKRDTFSYQVNMSDVKTTMYLIIDNC